MLIPSPDIAEVFSGTRILGGLNAEIHDTHDPTEQISQHLKPQK